MLFLENHVHTFNMILLECLEKNRIGFCICDIFTFPKGWSPMYSLDFQGLRISRAKWKTVFTIF